MLAETSMKGGVITLLEVIQNKKPRIKQARKSGDCPGEAMIDTSLP